MASIQCTLPIQTGSGSLAFSSSSPNQLSLSPWRGKVIDAAPFGKSSLTANAPRPRSSLSVVSQLEQGNGAQNVVEPCDSERTILGIDIGGTTIKAALVNMHTGDLVSERHVIDTPNPATPEAVACVLKAMLDHFQWTGEVGVGLPAVVRNGVVCTAANIDKSWIGSHAEEIFEEHSGVPMVVVNDADAAGYAEIAFGAGSGEEKRNGIVMMVTFGTGIGTAMFVNGILVPNLELGHLELDGVEAEQAAAGVLVKQNCWSWKEWAVKVQWYLSYLERLMWPSLFVIGGGVSNAHEEWLHEVNLPNKTPIKVATMRNDAGIVGAALAAVARAAYAKTQKPQQVQEYVNM